jgi:hypothetical protein
MRDLVATVEGVVIGFGDMNLDGSIDAIDLPFVLADLVGPASSTPVLIPEADMDGDDDVDLTDIAAFMNAFTGGD